MRPEKKMCPTPPGPWPMGLSERKAHEFIKANLKWNYKRESRNPSHQHFLRHQVINKKSSLIYQTNKMWDLPIKLNPRGIYIMT